MSSRLSKQDFFVVFMILLSLACLIGGFFLGASFSRSKAEAEFKRYIAEVNEQETSSTLLNYAHTDFVAYYHQVYLPFKEFRELYISQVEAVDKTGNYTELASAASSLQKQMTNISKEIERAQIPHTSPLLQKSQKELIQALLAYEQGFHKLSNLEKESEENVASFLRNSEEFTSGTRHWLKGQTQFYEALLLWESFFVTKEKPQFIENPSQYTLSEWSELGFHQKNDLIAKLLEELQMTTMYNPEDVTVYINSLASHQRDGSQKVIEAVQFLSASDSIREGQFIEKIKEYETASLPMIPLFSN